MVASRRVRRLIDIPYSYKYISSYLITWFWSISLSSHNIIAHTWLIVEDTYIPRWIKIGTKSIVNA